MTTVIQKAQAILREAAQAERFSTAIDAERATALAVSAVSEGVDQKTGRPGIGNVGTVVISPTDPEWADLVKLVKAVSDRKVTKASDDAAKMVPEG